MFFPVLSDLPKSDFIAQQSDGRYTWTSDSKGLKLFDGKSKLVYSNNYNPIHHPLLSVKYLNDSSIMFRYVMLDDKNNVWVTTWANEFYKYNPSTQKLETYSMPSVKTSEEGRGSSHSGLLINCMLEDNHGKIWIATENAGLLSYNETEDNFDYDIMTQSNPGSIRYNYKIFNLFQDREENIWVSTDRGVNIFHPYKEQPKFIRHQNGNLPGINKNEITSCIQLTGGDIYIGTWGGGVAVYDSDLNFKKIFFLKRR